jgi:SWI/SNF-related matrix-associated actin-dependent regulator of chromatin subfamily A member 5
MPSKLPPRQRQDLRTASVPEREMNDRGANELYEQLYLGAIRAGLDPNKPDLSVMPEGYFVPPFDVKAGLVVAHQERKRVAAVLQERCELLNQQRKRPEHKRMDPFERTLLETEIYTGRKVSGAHSAAAVKGGVAARRANASSAADLDEIESSQQGLEAAMHITSTPSYIRGTLRDYQIEGVNWLLGLFHQCGNGILADEMGLGKTFQTIAALAFLKFSQGLAGPHLVVVPKSVLGNWYREFRQWCPGMSVYKFHARGDIRPLIMKAHLQNPLKYDVIVTTYEMAVEESTTLKKIPWQYLIVDEAHKLKNDQSKAHGTLTQLHAAHRLIITGTPLQNNLRELWALLHFLSPHLFDDSSTFEKWFDTDAGQQDVNAVSRMHILLHPYMLRRLKSDVNTGIPPKKEIIVSCQLSKKQRDWYLSTLSKDADVLNRMSGGSLSKLENILMQLRKVINHPYIMPGGEEGPPFKTDERLIKDSGKMVLLDKLLKRLLGDTQEIHKILIFSQFVLMVNILDDYCTYRGFKFCRIDGNTSSMDRDMQMAQFNSPTSEYRIFLLSTRAGGLGINLQAANHVILYDSDWNPQMDLQAQDRAHRIGQKRSVRVYRFITTGTIEDRMYRRALKKLYLDAMVVQQGRVVMKGGNRASREEILSMIKFGAEEIFKSRTEDITDEDIDRLIEDGESKAAELASEAKATSQMSLANFTLGVEESNVYDFEGISYKSGVETKTLQLVLPSPISQDDLAAKCAKFGEVTKVVIHPNLTAALVTFRTQSGATDALEKIEYKATYAVREAQAVVTSEMIDSCWTAAEKLGRGHRNREPVQFYTDDDIAKMQQKVKIPPPRLPRKPEFKVFQLFNQARLTTLHNTEVSLLVRNWKLRSEAAEGVEIQDEALTAQELEERERLLNEGFPHWTHREFRALIRILTGGKVARNESSKISEGLAAACQSTKSPGEVRDYVDALFERGPSLIPKFDVIERNIAKAQIKASLRTDCVKIVRERLEKCDDIDEDFKIGRGRVDDFERKMFLHAYEHQFDNLKDIAQVVKKLPENRFDIVVQTRDLNYFAKRVRQLMVVVKRDAERELQEAAMGSELLQARKKRRKDGGTSPAAAPPPPPPPPAGEVPADEC